MYFQVTLNKGRTDTLTVEADSITKVKTFFEIVSTANITIIKKIVYSKKLGFGSANTSYVHNNEDRYLKVFVKNEIGETGTLNIQYPIKNLTKKQIITSVKKNLLLGNKPIVEVLNILKQSDKLGL